MGRAPTFVAMTISSPTPRLARHRPSSASPRRPACRFGKPEQVVVRSVNENSRPPRRTGPRSRTTSLRRSSFRNRIAPRLSTLTLRAYNKSIPMVVYRMPPRSQFARARSQTFATASGRLRPRPGGSLPPWRYRRGDSRRVHGRLDGLRQPRRGRILFRAEGNGAGERPQGLSVRLSRRDRECGS